jgi:hypothetical protein
MSDLNCGIGSIVFGSGIGGLFGTIIGFVKSGEGILIEKSLIN